MSRVEEIRKWINSFDNQGFMDARGHFSRSVKRIVVLLAEIDRLKDVEAENERLRAAAKPFVEVWEVIKDEPHLEHRQKDGGTYLWVETRPEGKHIGIRPYDVRELAEAVTDKEPT